MRAYERPLGEAGPQYPRSMNTTSALTYDVFISHASEDKHRFVDALDAALRERGLTCWYDARGIQLGDDFRRRMDDGLSRARFGVVVLSPNFFKYWPEAELSALFNQEATFHQKRILPVRLDLDRATLTQRSPLLAARADVGWDLGVDTVADRIRDVVRSSSEGLPSARSRAYNLPVRRVRRLFGRDTDTERLLHALVAGRSVSVAASVEGLAGVGKTELALHLVDRLSETDRFAGGIFWLDADKPDLTSAWGGPIADALAVGAGPIEERAAAAIRLASSGGPILVVLDNVETWTRETEPHPLPTGSGVSLLLTTRSRNLGGPSFNHYELDVLDGPAARDFLAAISGRDLTREAGATELLDHLGGHTLALELAGSYLQDFPTVSCDAYLQKVVAGDNVEARVSDLVRYERTVRQALDVHKQRLDEHATRALLTAACFAQADGSHALLEACGVEAETLQALRRFHLIVGDAVRWRMHRLVRAWAVESATLDELTSARRAFAEGCITYSESIDLAEGFRAYRADGPHLLKVVSDIRNVLGEDERVGQLLGRVGTALHSAGDLSRAKALKEEALAFALKLGSDHPLVATSQSNLAIVLRALGDLKRAAELLEQALESDRRNLGADDPSVAIKESNLAVILQDLGDLPRAKELLEQALASDLKNLREDHPSVATRRSNLALVVKDLGDLQRARTLLEEALAALLKNYGPKHSMVSTCRSNLALVLKDLGDLQQAKAMQEQGLALDLENYGADHHTVATSQFNLGQTYVALNDFETARTLLAEALATEERSLGQDHPSTAYTRASLAQVLAKLGHLEQARREVERALQAVSNQPEGSEYRREVERIARNV